MFGFDFLGFGNRRRWALQALDRSLRELEVNPAYVDDGMRYAIYKWAMAEEARMAPADYGALDRILREAATLLSFCIIGAAETESLWGPEVRAEREARFEAVLNKGEDETFDARIIKLALAKGVAAPDIRARAVLENDERSETA